MAKFQNPWGKGGKYWPGWDEDPWAANSNNESLNRRFSRQSSDNWDPILDTARNASYLSPVEKDVVFESNKFRSDPAKYAEDVLIPMRKFYSGKKIKIPGILSTTLKEGDSALEECISYITGLKENFLKQPRPILMPSLGMSKAAKDHRLDMGSHGTTGHVGSDGSKIEDRILRYCLPDFSKHPQYRFEWAENVAGGSFCKSGKYIVALLLIDDGHPNREHRSNLIHLLMNSAGVSVGTHSRLGLFVVQKFSTGVFEK